jgi:signal transduction histidine kinase
MIYRHTVRSTAGIIFCLLAMLACQTALAAEPKRVMILHSFGRDFRPWIEYAKAIRTELDRQSPWPLEFIDQSLMTARGPDEDPEVPFVEYLRAIFSKRPIDLIVSIGAPAAAFVQRRRQQLFPTTPMIFTAVEERRVQQSRLTEFDTVVAISHTLPAIIENILQVLPDTKTIAVVNGNSTNEKFWLEELRREFSPFADRVSFIWYNDQSFEDILKHAAALPPHSAIFWHLMSVDAAGVAHEGDTALQRLYAVANAPIFTYDGAYFGREIVGGPMHSVPNLARLAANAAVRILGGEKAGDVKIPASKFATPIFDWRLMQRWGVSESRLPPGSQIYFREPSVWEQYQLQIMAIFATLLLQAILILWLIYEQRRRSRAEMLAHASMAELTHMNRVAAAGELSASIAHEVNQPITGMVLKAGAALRSIPEDMPNAQKVRDLLRDIVSAGQRAGEIVTSIRGMFKRDTSARVPVNLNKKIEVILALLKTDLQSAGVRVEKQLDEQLTPVTGDPVQLQQVILNLIVNAADAMRAVQPRELKVQSSRSASGIVRVSIEDSGTGISASDLNRIFDPMFTTKSSGMGMGLSICRTIIENHGGKITVSAAAERGTIFQFELPEADAAEQPEHVAA